jgi:hypothetical protein
MMLLRQGRLSFGCMFACHFLGMTNMTGDSAHVTMSLSLLTTKISTKTFLNSASPSRKRPWFV